MKVTLIDYTQDALTLLLRTKGTRLGHADDPATWSEAKRMEHLAYMRDTIKSSWEFVSYTFQIEGVTRAFTHQLVRTRHGSYAQESQRTVDVSDHSWETPPGLDGFDALVQGNIDAYAKWLVEGAAAQDARGILPTNIHTSIIAKYTLRTLHEMAMVRLCTRTQGEYQEVFKAMKAAVVAVHPWADPFIRVACAQNGICVFPRYKECPIQQFTYNGAAPGGHASRLVQIQAEWTHTTHVAKPVAKDGMTQ